MSTLENQAFYIIKKLVSQGYKLKAQHFNKEWREALEDGEVFLINNKDNIMAEKDEKLKLVASDMYIALQCVQALDLPYQTGKEILEANGFDYSNRFEVSAQQFTSNLVDRALKDADELLV